MFNAKFARPQNNRRPDHPALRYCHANWRNLRQLAQALGPKQMGIMSRDNKSSLLMGVKAAETKQHILMNVKYDSTRLKMDDHDFPIGSRHRLVPHGMLVLERDPKFDCL